VRTLVVSDLHLGNRLRHDVLRMPEPRARLLEALDGVDRLVLLGDTIELMSRHPRRSMAAAEPMLRAIGRRMGADREVIFVPGNHDRPLVGAWVRIEGSRLTPDSSVEPDASPALRRVLSWLTPARTQIHYPGVWLSDGIWATPGHYLDKDLIPESAFGLLRRRGRRSEAEQTGWPSVYESGERHRQRSCESLPARLLAPPVGTSLEAATGLLLAVTMPYLLTLLMNVHLAPVTASLLDLQMRHASIPAMARVASRLGVRADWIVFGHVHRRGPLAGASHSPATSCPPSPSTAARNALVSSLPCFNAAMSRPRRLALEPSVSPP